MMQITEPWHRFNPAIHIGPPHRFTTCSRLLRQRKTCPVLVVVTDVLVHQTFQMPLVQDNQIIEQITATVNRGTPWAGFTSALAA